MHKNIGCIALLILLIAAPLQAQILNDSVQSQYGPGTVSIRRGWNVLALLAPRQAIDTSIRNLHHFDDFFQEIRNQKTMGYIGSPATPFFLDASRWQPGTTLGRDQLGYLFLNPDSLLNYQTYSLFSRVKYNQGSYGRQWLEATASRNFSPFFNLSGTYRRLTSQRQINVTRQKQKSVFHDAFAFNGNGAVLRGRLRYSATYSFLNYLNYETGGIKVPRSELGILATVDSLFDFDLEQARFDNNLDTKQTFSRERRRSFEAKAAYGFDSARSFQFLAGYRLYRQEDRWYQPVRDNLGVYNNYYFSSDSSSDLHRFQQADYSLGFEGALFKKVSLSAEGFLRRFYYRTGPLSINSVKNELHFVGNFSMQNVAFIRRLNGYVHLVQPSAFTLGGVADLPFVRVEFATGSVKPSLYSLRFNSNNFIWNNTTSIDGNKPFTNQKFVSVKGSLGIRVSRFHLAPYVQYQLIDDYIYYGKNVVPVQTTAPITIGYYGLNTSLDLKRFQTDLFAQTMTLTGPDVLRQPDFFARLQTYFKLKFAQGRYEVQPGVETRWRTGFLADKYEPVTGQFYLQDRNASGVQPDGSTALQNGYLPANTYFLTSVFVNVKINRTRAFLKMGNLLQGLGGKGYFDVPYYPGQRRYFEFGVDWMFFD